MPTEIPDLWGDDIDVDVVPPLAILKTQAEAISRRTKGILKAEVVSSPTSVASRESLSLTADTGGPLFEPENSASSQNLPYWIHMLVLQAPAIEYEEELLTVSHHDKRLYPVTIEVPSKIIWTHTKSVFQKTAIECNDQQELLAALSTALGSAPTKSVLNSLLAKVNETKLVKK